MLQDYRQSSFIFWEDPECTTGMIVKIVLANFILFTISVWIANPEISVSKFAFNTLAGILSIFLPLLCVPLALIAGHDRARDDAPLRIARTTSLCFFLSLTIFILLNIIPPLSLIHSPLYRTVLVNTNSVVLTDLIFTFIFCAIGPLIMAYWTYSKIKHKNLVLSTSDTTIMIINVIYTILVNGIFIYIFILNDSMRQNFLDFWPQAQPTTLLDYSISSCVIGRLT